MDLNDKQQSKIYKKHLRPLEKKFGRNNFNEEFATFVRAFLALRTGQRPPQAEIYRSFKEYAALDSVHNAPRAALTEDLHTLGRYYCAISRKTEKDPQLGTAFKRLLELKAEPSLPLLLRLYQERENGKLQNDEFARIVGTVESYLLRRAVGAFHPGSHIHTFIRLARSSQLGQCGFLEYVNTQLLLQSETARFPRDDEFRRTLKSADLYSRPCVQHVLASLENHDNREFQPFDDYSVEHIMPQQSPLPAPWCKELGRKHRRIQQRRVHTLGNLTLTRYNPELGASSFAEKRDAETIGYRSSCLRTLNEDLCQASAWTGKALKRRGKRLAELALSVWPYPSVPAATLKEAEESTRRVWAVEGHPQLQPGTPMRDLYDLICQAFAKLDLQQPEPLRNYISFKAGGANVVDIIPLRRQLKCYLNTTLSQLSDPLGMAVEHPAACTPGRATSSSRSRPQARCPPSSNWSARCWTSSRRNPINGILPKALPDDWPRMACACLQHGREN